jgi:hypothetical protein
MILVKGTLAGLAALITAVLASYGLAVSVPRILELIPSREGGIGVFFFPVWPLLVLALLIFSGGFYWDFRRPAPEGFIVGELGRGRPNQFSAFLAAGYRTGPSQVTENPVCKAVNGPPLPLPISAEHEKV